MPRWLHLLMLKVFRALPRPGRRFVVHRLAPSFTVGAICVVERADGAILLLRHSYRRRWGFPGGLLQRGEEVHDAALREAREEVGVEIELVGEPAVVVDAPARRVDVVFRARLAPTADADAVRSSSPEVLESRWFPAEDLPELQHEASTALVALARATRARGNGSGPLQAPDRPRPGRPRRPGGDRSGARPEREPRRSRD